MWRGCLSHWAILPGRSGHGRTAAVLLLFATAVLAADPSDTADDAARRSYQTATGLLDRGFHEMAISEFQRFLSDHPEHEKAALARYGLGVSYYRLGRCADAVPALTPLRDRTGFAYAAEVLAIVGQCRLGEKDYTSAVEAFGKIAATFPGHALADDAAAGAVEAFYGENRIDEADRLVKEFARQFPESPLLDRVEFFGASCNMTRKQFAAAAESFGRIAGRTTDGSLADRATFHAAQCLEQGGDVSHAIKQYGRVLERKDAANAADSLLALAEIAERQERYDEAGKLVDRLLERFPQSELRASGRLVRGRVWLAQEKFGLSIQTPDSLVDESSLDRDLRCEAAYHAARARLRSEAYADAVQRFEQVIGQFAGCSWEAEARYDLGVALLKADRTDAAFAAFRDVRAMFPDHELAADALHAMAGIEHRRRNFDECVQLARRFVGQYAEHKLASSSAFLIGESEFLVGRYAESVEDLRAFLTRYPKDVRVGDARSRLGAALYRIGKLDEAEPVLREAGNEGTGNARANLVALGDVYFQRGEWKQAEEVLANYLQGGADVPAAEDALLRLGLAQTRQGRNEDAVGSFEKLLSRFPNGSHRAQAVFEKGQALVSLERIDKAESAFRAVLDDPTATRFRVPSLRHLAVLSMHKQNYAAGARYFQQAAEQSENVSDKRALLYQQGAALMAAREFPAARAVLTSLTTEGDDPGLRAASRAQLGVALARENRCADAVDAFREMDGGWAAVVDPSLRSAAQYDQAWCLRELGRTDDAALGFKRLADGEGGAELTAFARLDLANLEASAKRWDGAVEQLLKLVDMQATAPGSVSRDVAEQALYRLGVCELERGRFAESSKALEDFLVRFPESGLTTSVEFFAGESAFRSQRWELAVRHFTRLTEQFPSDSAVDTAYLRLGDALASLQRWTESERAYAEYLSRFGDREQWFTAQFGVGWSRENQRKYNEAIDAYEKVIVRHDGETAARAQFQIGECHFAQRRFDDAVRELLKVDILYAYPNWRAAALFEAGRCFKELKKSDEASGQFRRVVENHSGTQWAELAAKHLSELAAPAPGR